MESRPLPLRVVDGLALPPEYREALRPGRLVEDEDGRARRLPRFFYEVDTWLTAKETFLAPRWGLYEFIAVDVREAPLLRRFPRYIPCAVAVLAAHLTVLRQHLGTYVHVAANGGYRSPAHALSHHASTHMWATAANIYRIGDDDLDTQETIERYAAEVHKVLPHAWIRPYGHSRGFADDHLHLDLGYVEVTPRHAAGEPDAVAGALGL